MCSGSVTNKGYTSLYIIQWDPRRAVKNQLSQWPMLHTHICCCCLNPGHIHTHQLLPPQPGPYTHTSAIAASTRAKFTLISCCRLNPGHIHTHQLLPPQPGPCTYTSKLLLPKPGQELTRVGCCCLNPVKNSHVSAVAASTQSRTHTSKLLPPQPGQELTGVGCCHLSTGRKPRQLQRWKIAL